MYSYGNGSQLMASVNSLASTLQQQLADALTAALPDAGTADPLLRRSDRADFQANGILALAKKLKGNPRELASQVTAALPASDLIKDIEVSGPGFLNITLSDKSIIETLAARAADGEGGSASRTTAPRAPRSSTTPSRTWPRRCTSVTCGPP